LAREDLSGAEAVGGDFGATSGGDERFVLQALVGDVGAAFSHDDVLEFGDGGAAGEEPFELLDSGDDDYFGGRMVEDVGHPVGGFVEVDGDGDAARARDGEVGGVPLGAIGGENGHAVAGFDAEFDEGHGEACDAAEEFGGGDGMPGGIAAKELGARIRERIDGVQEARREGAVAHGRCG